MDIEKTFEAVEKRAFDARKTMAEDCNDAGISPQVWSRAKNRKAISVVTLRNVEGALDRIEGSNNQNLPNS